MSVLSFIAASQISKKKAGVMILVLLLFSGGLWAGHALWSETPVDLDTIRDDERAAMLESGWTSPEDVDAKDLVIEGLSGEARRLRLNLEVVKAEFAAQPAKVKWRTKLVHAQGLPTPPITIPCPDGTEVTCPPAEPCPDCPGDIEISMDVQTQRVEDAIGPIIHIGAACEVTSSLGWSARRPEVGYEIAESVRYERSVQPQSLPRQMSIGAGLGFMSANFDDNGETFGVPRPLLVLNWSRYGSGKRWGPWATAATGKAQATRESNHSFGSPWVIEGGYQRRF